MPIITLDGREAVRIRKTNAVASWGNRNEDNRVEPIAKPFFAVPFRFKKGEKIFTIGSCFARNVETELRKRGFKLPMHDVFRSREFADIGPEIFNNFGTPSIYNELAWAFGERTFEEDKGFVEVRPGQFIDLHLVPSIRPGPIEDVRKRRNGLTRATRSLKKCRVLIMTLGLVELWFDKDSGDYLNTAPLPSTLNAFPDRFALHVLSFDDCYRYLRQAFDIAFKHGRKDLRVVLTVSPVPMMATHRPCDVMAANGYSKSVLRAVAEQICAEDQRIIYFPSYESITLSDRRAAWMDDLVHVTHEIVTFNVERMVRAFAGETDFDPASPVIEDLAYETAETLFMAERAEQARAQGDSAFFDKERDWAARSPTFAIEYARFLRENGNDEEALATIANDDSHAARVLQGELLFVLGEHERVIERVDPLCRRGISGYPQWRLWLNAAAALRKTELLTKLRDRWIKADPRRKTYVLTQIGSGLRRAGDIDLAMEHLTRAMDRTDANAATKLEMASVFIGLQRYEEATDILQGITPEIASQKNRIDALMKRICAAQTR